MTLNELSASLGYRTHSYLSEIESGVKIPSAGLVLKIADLFDVTTDQLMRDELEVVPRKLEIDE
jgi:transcriptional regulator with XRE-family HTH domain